MKLKLLSKDTTPVRFEDLIELTDDLEIISKGMDVDANMFNNDKFLKFFINDINNIWWDPGCENLMEWIDSQFDYTSKGEFSWECWSDEYYELHNQLMSHLMCYVISDNGDILREFKCKLAVDGVRVNLINNIIELPLPDFYTGNGELAGVKLAMRLIEHFIISNVWHIGLIDENGQLASDNELLQNSNAQKLTPIVWFGLEESPTECWSITTETTDEELEEFWGDYISFEIVCGADSMFDYTIMEYGEDFDHRLFDHVKTTCPINLKASKGEREKALWDLILKSYALPTPKIQRS